MAIRLKSFLFAALLCSSLLYGEDLSYSDFLKNIEERQVGAAREVLADLCPQEELWNDLLFSEMVGGLTRARLYSCDLNGKSYVFRFLDPRKSDDFRKGEIAALRTASDLAIAPICLAADHDSLLTVMPFVKGHPLCRHDLDNKEPIRRLGESVASLHNYSGRYPTRITTIEKIEEHYRKGVEGGVAYPTGFGESVRSLRRGEISSPLVPCHGDLHPANILVDEDRVTIIDWTCATWDDPFSDLSLIAVCANMTCDQEEILLSAYYGRAPTAEERSRLKAGKLKVYLLTAAIWFRCSEDPEDKKINYHERVSKLDAQLSSPDLKKAEEYLREGRMANLKSDPREEVRLYAISFYKAFLENVEQKDHI